MSKQFDSMMVGLQEALDYAQGDTSKCTVRKVKSPIVEPLKNYTREQIKAIRNKNNLSQRAFAEFMGVTPQAVEAWEAGKRKPTGTALRLFQLVEKNDKIFDELIVNRL